MAHQGVDQDTTKFNVLNREDEYYIRYFFLLTRGGTELLSAIFQQALQQKGEDLKQFLSSIKPAIQHSRHLKREQKDILYPATQDASIENFDITLLSHLIIRHLPVHVDKNVLPSVEKIRDLRNKYAHQAESKMKTFIFHSEFNDLVTIIRNGMIGISKEVEEKIINLIDSIYLGNQAMTEYILNDIKILVKKEDFTQSIQRKFEDIQTGQNKLVEQMGKVHDTSAMTLKEVRELRDEIRKKEERGEKIKIDETINGHAQINRPDEETKVEVLNLLAKAWRILQRGSPPTDNIQENLAAFCQDIKQIDVELKNISSGSIVFEFKCCTLKGIVDLIDYFYSPIFQKRLDAIADGLGEVIGKKISIRADGINRQSLECVTSKTEKKDYQNVMQFEMSCTGIDGLLHVMEVFEGGKAAGSLNKLSKALSNAVGKPVKLHSSIDKDQIKTALQSIRNQLELKHSSNRTDESKINQQSQSKTEIKQNLQHMSEVFDQLFFEQESERDKIQKSCRQDLTSKHEKLHKDKREIMFEQFSEYLKSLEERTLSFWEKFKEGFSSVKEQFVNQASAELIAKLSQQKSVEEQPDKSDFDQQLKK